jgi:predicted dehydrogenase/threonine dehydrogenase-like Zn-dependent dehydrogenase
MLQAIIKKGKIVCEEVPAPVVREGHVLIKVVNSCISAGTEVSGMQNSGEPLFKRALKQPENVKKVRDSIKAEGLVKAYQKVKRKLNDGRPTGYSLSGIVIGIGQGDNNFEVGDRVSAAGAGVANHAEIVDVPFNLVVKIPDDLGFKEASTVTLGAIAMHGVRRGNLKLGEFGVVFGTGILGLLTVQYLSASGVRIAAIDLDDNRLKLAKEFGAEITLNPSHSSLIDEVHNWTEGRKADAVLFTASTLDNEPLSTSFKMCKKKGKVVMVGVSGLAIKRDDVYTEELDFQVSTSYGPGRYDQEYELHGNDYPYAYVRWTENRNMKEYLRLLSVEKIKLDRLIENTFPITNVSDAFQSFNNSNNKPIMVILDYGKDDTDLEKIKTTSRVVQVSEYSENKKLINTAVIGAGGFATGIHLPNLNRLSKMFKVRAIASRNGVSAKNAAKAFGAEYSTTDINDILSDDSIDLVIITTSHESHGDLVIKSLNSGKHVFVEKPLTIYKEELEKINCFYKDKETQKPLLLVGYNRRFSKYAQEIRSKTDSRFSPLFIQYRMNAGFVPNDNWIYKEGGRIVGEVCHIIDLMTYLTGAKVTSLLCENLSPKTEKYNGNDNKSIVLKYSDGSVCNIQYFAVGNKSLPKEYMEVHFDNKTIILDDYKKLTGYGIQVKRFNEKRSDKGHMHELEQLYYALTNQRNSWPIELWDLIQTSEVSLLLK